MSINKLKNAYINNDTSLTGSNSNNLSMINKGKTELQSDTVINTKLSINKAIDTVNDYKLDVNGNINFIGDIYKNNALYSSGFLTSSSVLGQTNILNGYVDKSSTQTDITGNKTLTGNTTLSGPTTISGATTLTNSFSIDNYNALSSKSSNIYSNNVKIKVPSTGSFS